MKLNFQYFKTTMTLGVNVGRCMPTLMGKGIEIDKNSGECKLLSM